MDILEICRMSAIKLCRAIRAKKLLLVLATVILLSLAACSPVPAQPSAPTTTPTTLV